MPEPLANLVILAQIGVFMGVGFLAALLERTVTGMLLAVLALAYGVSLYLFVFAGLDLTGWPSLFLLAFIVVLVVSGMRDRFCG
jgi:predicted membrane metal-binding protein